MDDGNRIELVAKDYIVEVYDADGYLMCNLLADLANKTKWGSCQDPAFWYWDTEKNGLQCAVVDDDLNIVFQKFQSRKYVSLIVEFLIKSAIRVA